MRTKADLCIIRYKSNMSKIFLKELFEVQKNSDQKFIKNKKKKKHLNMKSR